MGKARFVQSLETESLTVAQRKVHLVVGVWKAEIEAAKGNLDPIKEAMRLREKAAEDPHIDTDYLAWQLVERDEDGNLVDLKPEHEEQFTILAGQGFPYLHYFGEYEKTLVGLAKKTISTKKSDIERFSKKFKYCEDATKKNISLWLDNIGLSNVSLRRLVGSNKLYWEWLNKHKNLNIDPPFNRVIEAKRETGKVERDIWSKEDYKVITEACSDDIDLYDLIKLAAYTGCRIRELCNLTISDVFDDRIRIKYAKSRAGNRDIPIHEEIRSIIFGRRETSADGFVFSGFNTDKNGDRSNALGKRFTKIKQELGYGEELVFHGWRKAFIAQLLEAGIPELTTANLVGHKIKTLSYGVYAGNRQPFSKLQEAIQVISW